MHPEQRSERTSAGPRTTTTFFVPGTHCSTCASFIETTIRRVEPDAVVETSILSHSVTIRHGPQASIKAMARALGNSGYEVQSIAMDPEAQPRAQDAVQPNATDHNALSDDFVLGAWFNHPAQPWNVVGRIRQRRAKQRHIDNCFECKMKLKPGSNGHSTSRSALAPPTAEPGGAVSDVVPASAPQLSQVEMSIEGMSCSSCVGKITETLTAEPWIEAADVSLLNRSALVRFRGADKAEDIVRLIEDIGYDARIESVQILDSKQSPNTPDAPNDVWRAQVSINGMSCSSCVGKITKAVEAHGWVQTVNVNLVASSATVEFKGKSHLQDILDTIKASGYDAKLSDVVNTNALKDQPTYRTVAIRVDNMYCEHCPDRVIAAMQSMESTVTIDEMPTLRSPIMTVSYTPRAPDFTIRTILSAITSADPALDAAIHHPPTVEERSKQIHEHNRRQLLYRLLLAVAAAIPGFVIGIVYMSLVSEHDPNRVYLMEKWHGVSRAEWALLVISTPVYFFGADVFHRRTIKELFAMWKPGSPVPLLRRFYRFGSMDMLVSFATTIAYAASIAQLAISASRRRRGTDMPEMSSYFDSVIFLTMFLLIGRMIEAYSKAKTGEAVTKLGQLRPKEALLITSSGQRVHAPTDTLETGDSVVVVHGASPPWDGTLLDKEAEFSEASLTGESRSIMKTVGDDVYAGTINKGAAVTIRIQGAAGESLLDNIIRVVREGQAKRAPIERLADTITGYFVPFVTLFAIVTWLIWLGLGESGRLPDDYKDVRVGGWPFWSLQFAIAIFVIACPCGIGLAAPTALFVGGGLAAKHGILAKGGGEAFQEASDIDIIVFDKTGTLTEGGDLKITEYLLLQGGTNEQVSDRFLSRVGQVERNSSHPIAKALVAWCEKRGSGGATPREVQEIPGKGMMAVFSPDDTLPGMEMIVGNERLMHDHKVQFDASTAATLDVWKDQAKSVILVASRQIEGDAPWEPAAVFASSDPVRAEAQSVVASLHDRGVDVWMLSGDNAKTAEAVGAMVSIPPDRIIAGVLPEQKADKVKYLQGSQPSRQKSRFAFKNQTSKRAIVAMIGDGVNDAPALTAADVGIAIGAGSDVAISAAGFVLIKSDLDTLLTLIELSRAVFRRVKFNFLWASVYNVVALPIAAGVLYPIKTNGSYTRLDPVWASLAMALSSVSVISSSLLLRSKLPLVGFRTSNKEPEHRPRSG
ncbi:E1-E2 ATPase-domain-containing protein [Emericellopsis atlantica]|uniref:E1-E2 ATPase-domain-containing protein n=1 Tax=Emericellopsis atlantica TaxID=2614577 RepID=A0A9P7ZLN5_9HYPO|nr:E1-E2 ATPase-domain-containing protein [Emericellopsis atlantica]KAG9254389.1 E1-E2 ATPase-domain-containing protein [Emericellopsis atlantica]